MKKYSIKLVVYVAVLTLIVGILIPKFSFFGKDKETSFKTGNVEQRYIRSFAKTPLVYPEDNSNNVKDVDVKNKNIEHSLSQSCIYVSKMSILESIENERIMVYVTDIGNARFLLQLDKGVCAIGVGYDTNFEPTMVVPLTTFGINNLEKILKDSVKDKKLSYESQYLIYNAIAAPALQSLYNSSLFFVPGDKTMFKFDDLVHIVIPPEKPVYYQGVPLSIQLTAANVDGQWMVFEGLKGDPDFKISLTLDQATWLYKKGVYDLRNINSLKDATNLSQEFLDFLNKTTVYTRADHK